MSPAHVDAVASWLRSVGLSTHASVRLQALSGGQSNPTYIVDDGERRFVLRKKPQGQLIASAHAIDREYRVMLALANTPVPVPRMLGYCEDVALLGTPFYVMEFLEGRVVTDQSLPGMSPVEREAIYADMIRVLAALHAVDVHAVGLESFGKSRDYFQRQISMWSRQIREARVPSPPSLLRLMDWLPLNVPPGDEVTLIHGDYRLDNLVLHPKEPRIIGVLDWELSTLGHPLSDLGYHCMSWRIEPGVWRGISGLALTSLGIPPEVEYLRAYARQTGRNPEPHWEFYLAFNLFRMAAILQGIAQRAAEGTAVADDAVANGQKAGPLADLGWQCAQAYIGQGAARM